MSESSFTRRAAPGLAACAAALTLLACRQEEVPPATVGAPPVLVEPVRAYTVEERIEATGQLLALADASVAATVDGQVTRVSLDEGAAVRAGDAVIEIDPERRQLEVRSRRAGVVQARAQLAEAKRELARVQQLRERGAVSDARLDEVRTAAELAASSRDAAVAQLELAERALRDSSVRAPFAGFVARRYVSEGEFVSPGTPLFQLVAMDPVEVEFHLPERDSARVAVGVPVQVRVAPYPDERFTATVTVVSPTIDPRTRTLRVKAVIDNSEGRLRPGLFARAELGVALREGVPMVPEEAVLQRADGAIGFRLVDGDRVERRILTLGTIRDGRVEVVSGLAVGDRVVVRGHTGLIDGSLVSLRDREGRPLVGADATSHAGLNGEPSS